ncbi:Serpentine receptor class delta-34 [Caenorhabditis elegans]|uniref:Serpentine receptor class delta-34 n=1 Tax=Caenorhabditis elegans TaxID=6239 RepID=SRD34_CAEEL|nr:Serpentine receptor class delta-34 [Caenorhabditis elegans]Q19975.2 RecName: Full=Serpentine receptor class delta-34; Short=Protein srd-34 [Caenorhabditis elegans]CAA96645.2 Serpentine receptor class delta-34 [Caenorhabditis elegans]|eukprot:NP_505705.2 Serpentine receptor class delta-34 [Caenorhabditis elegans]
MDVSNENANSSIMTMEANFFMCIIVVFTQVRPVNNPESSAYLFSGFCRHTHKNACFFSFDFFQLVFDASSFAIPATLFYKYTKVTNINMKNITKNQIRMILLSSYLLSLIVGVIYVITYEPDESLEVASETRKFHSTQYDFRYYADITGYQKHFWSWLATNLNMISIFVPPIMSIVFIRLIQIKLNSLKHLFTDKTAAQAKKFDLALTIQTLVPAVCVIPIYIAHLILENYDLPFLSNFEKVLYMMLSLPTAIDAFIVIVTITPYQKAFIAFFKDTFCGKKVSPAIVRRNNISAVSIF